MASGEFCSNFGEWARKCFVKPIRFPLWYVYWELFTNNSTLAQKLCALMLVSMRIKWFLKVIWFLFYQIIILHIIFLFSLLTHCGLVTPYCELDWVNIVSSNGLLPAPSHYPNQCSLNIIKCVCGIHMRAISQNMLINLFGYHVLKIYKGQWVKSNFYPSFQQTHYVIKTLSLVKTSNRRKK